MERFKRKTRIDKLKNPFMGYTYNVCVLTSLDGGETWWYCGIGKYAKSEEEAREIAREYHKQTVFHTNWISEDSMIEWEGNC